MICIAYAREYLWRIGDLSWKLDSLQKKIRSTIYGTKADEVLILSGRQVGKSFVSVVMALEHCLKHPGSKVRIMAGTQKQVSDIVNDNLSKIILDAPPGLITRERSSNRWLINAGGMTSDIRIGPMERAHVDNNRGTNADLIILEEGGFIDSEDYAYAVNSVVSPQLMRSGGRLIHVSSPSTSDVTHYLHDTILPKCELLGSAFRYSIYDSPAMTPDLIAKAIERCGGENTIAFQCEYLGKIIKNEESVIIPTFDKSRHVKEIEMPEHSFMQIAIDWGGVRDKTVALLHTYDFKRNKKLWIDERVFEPNTPSDKILEAVRDMESGQNIAARYADVNGQLQIDLAAAGYEVQIPVKDDWRASINALQVSIGQNQHEISPKCRFLIQSLESGRYNKSRTDFHRNEILGHCDAIAAMGYGNRMMSETNPYPHIQPHRDIYFAPPRPPSDMEQAAAAIQPKTFANTFESSYFTSKKFGAFKR